MSKAIPSALALGLCLDAPAASAAAPEKYTISLPAGSLETALIVLAQQTGASIGYSGRLPNARVDAVRGTMSVTSALRKLLTGMQLQAIATGPMAWRVVAGLKPAPAATKRPTVRPPRDIAPVAAPTEEKPQDIIVTASKLGETAQLTPLSVLLVSGAELEAFGSTPDTRSVASLADGLVLTNLGPGRNRSFIRGIADSPFNGATQSTVAVELEDARVTFNAPDPDLRLVDIDRVELLEGPQGPLHGTGALGGVYRILPNQPKLNALQAEIAADAGTLKGGGTSVSGSVMLNLPVVADRLGLRAVAYGASDAGWIDRDEPTGSNSNSSRLRGARATLRWKPADDWNIDLAGVIQLLHVKDSQYATSLVHPYRRKGGITEPHDNDFINGRLTVHGRLAEADLISVTSWTAHEVDSVLDATAAGPIFGQTGPLVFEDDRMHRLINQEIRLSGGNRIRWLAGASYLSATTKIAAELRPTSGDSIPVGNLDQANTEMALFGDISVPIGAEWKIASGVRLFRALSDDERKEVVGSTISRTKRTGVSPSASISWTPDDQHFLYMRYASAFRPAGLSPFAAADAAKFESDELKSFELGGRVRSSDGHLTLSGTGYFANWNNIQSDYLLPNGLIATRNSGTGLIYGAEARVGWHNARWQLSGGLDLQHARLEKPEPGLALSSDHSLPIVPAYKAHLVGHRTFETASGILSIGARLNQIGAARLSLDPALDRAIGARTTFDIDSHFTLGTWQISAGIDNALGSHADTFGFGNPFSVTTAPQRTPVRPRTIRLAIRKSWP